MSPTREAVAKPTPKPASRRFGFLSDILSELKKVTWPSRRETANLTMIVVIVALAVGLFLGLVDFGFAQLMNWLLVK